MLDSIAGVTRLSTTFRDSPVLLGAALLLCAGFTASCKSPDPHTYRVKPGEGRVYYDPQKGVTREGLPDSTGEELYRRAAAAFNAKAYSDAALLAAQVRALDPDGPRAYESIVMEAVALAERGRSSQPGWSLNDLANAVIDKDTGALARVPPSALEGDIRARLNEMTRNLADKGALEESWNRTLEIFLYYSAAFGVVEAQSLHDMVQRHARNLAWYAYLGGDYVLAERISRNLVERTARSEIKATAELILADTAYAIGWYERSEQNYHNVAGYASDPDLQEEARYKEIKSIIGQSKGPEYDRKPYVKALAKVGEYKTDFVSQHPDARRHLEFARLEADILGVLHAQEEEAASTYRRVFQEDSAKFHDARAAKAAAEKRRAERSAGTTGALVPREK